MGQGEGKSGMIGLITNPGPSNPPRGGTGPPSLAARAAGACWEAAHAPPCVSFSGG